MLHPHTKLKWIDLESGISHDGTVKELYTQYAHKTGILEDIQFHKSVDQRGVHYKKDVVLIQDWNGWTDIVNIRKHKRIRSWLVIKPNNELEFHIGHDQLIPVYTPDVVSSGFHGETKYEYKIINADHLTINDNIRYRLSETGFINPSYIFYQNLSDPITGYEIRTKSGFFNANELYLYNK